MNKRFPGMKKETVLKLTPKKKVVNWASVYELYKPGMLTNVDICNQYKYDHEHTTKYKKTVTESAIRKKAKENGWQRNLTERVKEEVKEKLVREEVRNSEKTDDEIVDSAAEQGKNIIISHRKDVRKLRDKEKALLKELLKAKKSYITKFKNSETGEETIESKRFKLTVKEKSSTLKDLATVMEKRIVLERQAYNLDDAQVEDGVKIVKVANVTKPNDAGATQEEGEKLTR